MVQKLAAHLERVRACRLVLLREVVSYAPHALDPVPRQVLVLRHGEAPHQDARAAHGDVGRQPVVRPARDRFLIEQVGSHPSLDLVQGPIAKDLRVLNENFARDLRIPVRAGGVVVVAGAKRLEEIRTAHLGHQVRPGRQFIIQTHAGHLDARHRALRNIERRIRRVPDRCDRLVLVVEVAEEVHLVLADRTAEGRRPLLIRIRHDDVQHGIGLVELAVAEVAHEGSRRPVRPRLGDRVNLDAGRPALRRIEPVRDELKFRDRVLAVARLVAGSQHRRDLLAVDVELEFPDISRVSVLHRDRALRVRAVAGRQQRERHPVAAEHRQLGHLPRIDVAADARRRRRDQRRFACDRHALLNGRGRHLQIEDRRLSHLQFETTGNVGESDESRRDLIHANANGNAIGAAPIGHRFEAVARVFVHRLDGHSGKNAPGRVGNHAGQRGFLRVHDRGRRQDEDGKNCATQYEWSDRSR